MKAVLNINKLFLIFTILFSQTGLAQHHKKSDTPSVHGMLMFGQNKIYLSHLPMFHSPHNYQVILEVEIPELVKNKYTNSIKNNPVETVYTIVPESFILPDIVMNSKPFMAKIFKGHFERGGTPITENVKLEIKKVIYFKKFSTDSTKPKKSRYILIGDDKEQFLIHKIVAKPDFDYISKLKIEDAEVINKLNKVSYLNIVVDSPNTTPLQELKETKGHIIGSELEEVRFIISKSLYIEFGDLSF